MKGLALIGKGKFASWSIAARPIEEKQEFFWKEKKGMAEAHKALNKRRQNTNNAIKKVFLLGKDGSARGEVSKVEPANNFWVLLLCCPPPQFISFIACSLLFLFYSLFLLVLVDRPTQEGYCPPRTSRNIGKSGQRRRRSRWCTMFEGDRCTCWLPLSLCQNSDHCCACAVHSTAATAPCCCLSTCQVFGSICCYNLCQQLRRLDGGSYKKGGGEKWRFRFTTFLCWLQEKNKVHWEE